MKRLCNDNLKQFKNLLQKIVELDTNNLDLRFDLLIEALDLATKLNYEVGIGTDNKNPGIAVVYIQLPTGQVSWHMPNNNNLWDGHSTEEKYKRIEEFIGG
jgi:hypothetical protein